jgi:hypothetical protein
MEDAASLRELIAHSVRLLESPIPVTKSKDRSRERKASTGA